VEQLPLPTDFGEAFVASLHDGRPAGAATRAALTSRVRCAAGPPGITWCNDGVGQCSHVVAPVDRIARRAARAATRFPRTRAGLRIQTAACASAPKATPDASSEATTRPWCFRA
jgi:hypothetical protein